MKKFQDILREADQIIEKRASKTETTPVANDDEVVKLAEALMDYQPEKVASVQIDDETLIEKYAHAVAMVETIQLINEAEKLDKFVKTAQANGYNDEQIEKFIEDKSLGLVHKIVVLPEAFK